MDDEHLGAKRLIAYREETLTEAESEAVQEHLSLCPRCMALLRELKDFEAAATGDPAAGPDSLRQEAWDSLVRRLPARPRLAAPPRVPRYLYAAAAVLLLAVAGFSVRATIAFRQESQRRARLEQRLEETERQLDAAHGQIRSLAKEKIDRSPELEARISELTTALEVLRRTARAPQEHDRIAAAARPVLLAFAPRFVLRGQEQETGLLQAGGAVNPVRLPPRADRVTVALDLSDHPSFDDYRFELADRDGKVLWSGRQPARSLFGDAGTSVTMSGLEPGSYRLWIEGLHPGRAEPLAEYLLEVEPPAPK